jgi:UDP-2,3-diacylglucosamine pyrophosphatase LpxH
LTQSELLAADAATSTLSETSLPEPQPGVAELDCVPDRVLIVSDLHLGVGTERATGRYRPGENFLADRAFRSFLESYAKDLGSGRLVLVLNGDTFDFLRVDAVPELDEDFTDWQRSLRELGAERPLEDLKRLHRREEAYGLRTEDYKCVWKLDRIAEGHPDFFRGLGWWVEQGGWLVLTKGNHDVELFWPLVQLAIRREISRSASPGRVAAQVHFAQAAVRIGNVYIEHGHQFESTTAVKGAPVLPGEPPQLNLPLGSFVNRYIINSLERLEPFLDNIKPVDRALNVALRRHPLQVFKILWRSLPFLRRAARPYWLREWLAFAIYFASLVLPLVTIVAIVVALAWPDAVRRIPEALRPVLSVAGLIAPYFGGLLRDLMLRKQPAVGEDAYAEGLYERLARVSFEASHDVIYGVLGHTHRPDIQELPPLFGARILYLNTGTWIALWQDERPDLMGRVVYSVVSLVRGANGSYAHEYLEWRPDAGRLASARARDRPGIRRRLHRG